jgi:hypothetical protein
MKKIVERTMSHEDTIALATGIKEALNVPVLGPLAKKSLERPADFLYLPIKEQWQIDKELGILDWDGDPKK